MGLKPDHWIRQMAREQHMIEPFEEKQVRNGAISYGVSSYGYDIRVADEFKIFTNVFSAVVDPKNFDPKSMVDYKGEVCVIPPNSFALARTVEYFRIPRKVLTVCLGKCLTGDTRVVDAETGDYLPLRDFVARRGRRTVSLSEAWRLEQPRVTAHVNNGVRPVFRLTTRAGLTLKATANHPLRTWNGWTPLSDLKPGDRIAAARECPVFGQDAWPEHEATLLGLLLSDGQCCTPGHSPRYTSDDPALVEALTEAARAFGVEVSPVGRLGYNLVNHRGRGGLPEKNRCYAWPERLGCHVRSADKFVPSVVFTARRASVAAFLRALFSGDGSVYGSNGAVFLEYYSISQRLVEDVRHLLLRFGIFAYLRSKRLPSGGMSYRVQITDPNMIQRFAGAIGFVPGSQKQQTLEAMLAGSTFGPARRSNFDTLPAPAWAMMREAVHASGQTLAGVGIRGTQPDQSLPYGLARQAALAAGVPAFSAIVAAGVVWDTVESIEPCGEEEVFDLTVPGNHNFLANDLIVHNSTYARCGIIVNVTPFEPEWEGFVTLEISNTTPLPARIYSNEGIAQVLFFEADEECEISYADKQGKYQKQQSIMLPKL
jgi:deoxycytidine triphosphate deaminase